MMQTCNFASHESIQIVSRYVVVNGLKTHFLEAGEGPPLVLLHSGEFGGCAELSWEHTIPHFARSFHVIAPDWLGYGRSAKVFSFEDMWNFRINHVSDLLRTLGVGKAHFVGNSMGGTLLLSVAAMDRPSWDLHKIVVIAGGGSIPENEAREVLSTYDGSREHMRRIVETMFINPAIREDEAYIERRHRLSRESGAWECTAAIRFKAPWRERTGLPQPPDYGQIRIPILLVTGAQDCLREKNFGPNLQAKVPESKLYVIDRAGHCPHIDAADEFNRVVLDFLLAS
jgi:2-hydroxymuconate-semialdehyde hydrolase